MPVPTRLRRLLPAALPALLAVAFAACSTTTYPNSVFTRSTEFNREVGYLFKILIALGTFVFVFVEGILLYAIWRFRRKSDNDRPEHVHGNTTLEILWTAIPALILAFIAVPTVQTIFKTQAVAKSDALQVQVIGHQWWWEFRYPQYNFVTANELYLPVGRTVNFSLKSNDVLHSFSIPRLGGKRDLITNHENFLWFTPDSVGESAFNGMCAEYCGASHANMRFKVFTVAPADFEAWTQHQQSMAAFGAVAPTGPALGAAAQPQTTAPANPGAVVAAQTRPNGAPAPATAGGSSPAATPPGRSPGTSPTGGAVAAGAAMPAMPGHDMSGMPPAVHSDFVSFPHDKLPDFVIPKTPIPGGLTWNESVVGDAERGRDFISKGGGGCVGCHTIHGNPTMAGVVGPNLTHVATRTTIAGGLYPNDTKHLALWIKNARYMKPGVLMPTLGAFQRDPITNQTIPQSGLSDQQIADIVAYLQALK
jgi:cytochrome c oxidase subunit 2